MANILLGIGIWYMSQTDTYIAMLLTNDVTLFTMGSVLVCGLVLTLLCAFFSVNHYLRMRSNDLFLN
jgi:cell division transport system permease protein